jgi:putative sigma-54 modulation protein
MIIEYTGRQFMVTQKYRVQAEAGLERIAKVVGSAASAHVILTADKYRKIAEVTVKNGSPDMVANCESAEMMTALHDALAKVEQQAIRHRQRTTTIMRHPRVAAAKAVGAIGESGQSETAAANR